MNLSLHVLIGLIGLFFIIIFGGMSLLRREGLSIRFAVEAVCITAIATILVYLTPIQIHPVVFLLVLYIVTFRVRLLVDLANTFARRGNSAQAERIYVFAAHLWPDQTNDLIIKVNHAVLMLQKNQIDDSISLFKEVLTDANKGYLGVKYESAAHYNLGVAYLRKNDNSMATVEFNSVLDTWPASLYARRAQQALNRLQGKVTSQEEEKAADK